MIDRAEKLYRAVISDKIRWNEDSTNEKSKENFLEKVSKLEIPNLNHCIDKAVGIRMSPEEELLGADFVEHNILRQGAGIDRALAALCEEFPELCRADAASLIGHNSGHELYLERMMASRRNGIPPSRRSGDGEEESSVALRIEDEGQGRLPSTKKQQKRDASILSMDTIELPIITVNTEQAIKIDNCNN
ncbi:hypothetical protein J437_LFUL009107 [Ladona fulva]|uniref:Uncharacterized protein n=1 Tax=Ladona fulva TaxID=123851 RepID=A0A8K0P022_LADFU|nr:hypothetical protein J437_LFUL009107 [Ladona fulva]